MVSCMACVAKAISMNLITELSAERESLITEARMLMTEVALRARKAVESEGQCHPVIVALNGSVQEFYYPEWNTPAEKYLAFEDIRAELSRKRISATVFAIPSQITIPDTGEQERAVVIVAHTNDWKEMHVLPFRITEDWKVRWAKPFINNEFESNLFKSPYKEYS